MKPLPIVVLVYGAFAGSSSWRRVIEKLTAKRFAVVAVANPFRNVKGDAEYMASVLKSILGPVVPVGSMITNAAEGASNVKSWVYVTGFASDVGESASDLAGKFPGATLASSLAPAGMLPDGSKDPYISMDKYHAQFAADVGAADASVMVVTQRPVTEAALNEPSQVAAWKQIPSWFIHGPADRTSPLQSTRSRQIVRTRGRLSP